VVEWNGLNFASHLVQRNAGDRAVNAASHAPKLTFDCHLHAPFRQLVGEQAISRGWGAAADQRAQDGDVSFEVRGFTKAPCQQQGLRGVVILDAFERFFLLLGACGSLAGSQLHEVHQFPRPGFFGHSHQREVAPSSLTALNGLDSHIEIIRDFRDEDHIRTRSQPRAHG